MPAPSPQTIRPPAVAGLFYPQAPDACRDYAQRLIKSAPRHVRQTPTVVGALVPHAGWICSGQVAAEAIVHAAENASPDLVVVFGAVHTPLPFSGGSLDTHRAWSLPTGELPLPRDLEESLVANCQAVCFEPRLHSREHSIEVQIPFLQLIFGDVPVLPIEVEADSQACEVGRQTARLLQQRGCRPLFIASSDLTHYGENYGLTVAGGGAKALEWARHNDQRILSLIERLEAQSVVAEAHSHLNACGSGAVAAMLAAATEWGATRGQLLHHTCSHETLSQLEKQQDDISVGYAALAVG